MPFEYWNLPKSDNVTTRIARCYKDGKYIVFTRDDGKECKYDLATGEVIGFRGKSVKRLASQLKDLTCKRLFEITENPIYKQYFEWVWKWHPNGKAWVFFEHTMPDFRDYEQFFTSSRISMLGSRFRYGYSQIPKGLFKFCEEYDIVLTNELAKSYLKNPDVFNLINSMDFGKCTKQNMIKAMIYGCTFYHPNSYLNYMNGKEVIDGNNLLMRRADVKPNTEEDGRDSYFISLIDIFGYNGKLLLNYVDSVKINRRFKREIFRDIYDYADMMTQLYDNYDRYPENFVEAHKKTCEEYNRISVKYNEVEYTERNVLEYECEIDSFRFIYPRTTDDIKQEAKNQHNCVATYINRVLHENCHIMFMRPKNNIENSYITLEIRNNKIVQAKRKYNEEPSKEEYEIISKWNERYKDFKLQ